MNNKDNHPVNKVEWVETGKVFANDYNPNKVAPPEMKLLKLSIESDGFTQPIVVWKNNKGYEVIDGFHRHLVGRELGMTHLPVVVINKDRQDKNDRVASTIRHNRARGKHIVTAMSDIVVELKKRNWKDERICRELGMEQDEVLRLCQISGLSELFSDQEFSKSWDIAKENTIDFVPLSDDIQAYGQEAEKFRTINTDDKNRIFHTYKHWECFKAGFYATSKDGMTREQCEEVYRSFLSNEQEFSKALKHIIKEWKHSCEHYLTNVSMNRIAWLGQASCCYAKGIPAEFRNGFNLLTDKQQQEANELALKYLNKWLVKNKRKKITMEEAISDNQSDIY